MGLALVIVGAYQARLANWLIQQGVLAQVNMTHHSGLGLDFRAVRLDGVHAQERSDQKGKKKKKENTGRCATTDGDGSPPTAVGHSPPAFPRLPPSGCCAPNEVRRYGCPSGRSWGVGGSVWFQPRSAAQPPTAAATPPPIPFNIPRPTTDPPPPLPPSPPPPARPAPSLPPVPAFDNPSTTTHQCINASQFGSQCHTNDSPMTRQ